MGLQDLAVHRIAWGGRFPWWHPLLAELLCYQVWWLLTPIVLAIGSRFPLDRGNWRSGLVVHAAASVAVPVAYLAVCQLLVFSWARLRPPPTAGGEWFLSIVGNLHLEILTYWSIVAAQHGVRVFRERRDRELSLARAESRLVQAELTALKMQLEPHFLFNTLNAISALIHEDPEAADAMVVRLGEFLRLTLETAPRQLVPLREELGFLEKYLAIETVRFPDRLAVATRIDERTLEALVPTLCLQPLVENAVRHGIARQPGGGRVEIDAECIEAGRVRITVANTGPDAPVLSRTGVGLTNTLSRLSQVFGQQYTVDMRPRPGGGLRVEIVVPHRTAADLSLGAAP